MLMKPVAAVYVGRMIETGDRPSYWVTIRNAAGQTITPSVFRAYDFNGTEGLSNDDARDRALMEASEWADFFGIEMTPYIEGGVRYEPSMTLGAYSDEE